MMSDSIWKIVLLLEQLINYYIWGIVRTFILLIDKLNDISDINDMLCRIWNVSHNWHNGGIFGRVISSRLPSLEGRLPGHSPDLSFILYHCRGGTVFPNFIGKNGVFLKVSIFLVGDSSNWVSFKALLKKCGNSLTMLILSCSMPLCAYSWGLGNLEYLILTLRGTGTLLKSKLWDEIIINY